MNFKQSIFFPFFLRKLLLVIAFCNVAFNVKAQTKYADSLKNELKKNIPDSSRIDNLILLGDALGYSKPSEAMRYLSEAYQLAKTKQFPIRMGDALTGIGQAHYRSNNSDSCLYYLKLADPLFYKENASGAMERRIGSKMNMATVYRTKGDLETATRMYIEGINELQKMSFPEKDMKLITAYLNLGLVYNELNQYDKALYYHRKGLQLVNDESDKNVRVNYLRLHRIHDFIELKQYDSARYYLNKEKNKFEAAANPDIFSQMYSNWGMYYLGTGKEDSALSAFTEAYRYAKESENEFRQEGMLGRIGSIYKNKKQYNTGISFYKKAFALSHKIKDKPSEMNYLKNLASLYALVNNNAESVHYYQKYVHLSDSLNLSDMKKKINEIENKYQAKQKADSILVLRKNSEMQALALNKKENQNIFIVMGAVLLLLAALLFYLNLRNKHRLLKQSELLHQQEISQLEKERKLIAAQSLMKGQEEERSRLAKDLHDGVGGLLSGVKLSLSNMKGNVFLTEENAAAVTTIIGQLDNSINELRRVSHNMMPEALIKYGLKEALENYCENINRSGNLKARLQTYGLEQRMEQDTEIILYRIVQELLNNVIKHAAAKQVLVQLMCEADKFTLTVEDDGKGFDADNPPFQHGAGLQNIRARAGYLNGTVDIRTRPGEGTSVTVEGKIN